MIAATVGTLAAVVISLRAAHRRRARRLAALPLANRYARPTWTSMDQVNRF